MMSDFSKYPISPGITSRDPAKGPEYPPEDDRSLPIKVAAYLLQMFKKIIDALSEEKEPSSELNKTLIEFKTFLETLQKEDRSQDASLLNAGSKIWHELLSSDQIDPRLTILIKGIQKYPDDTPHTFGYYLTENTKENWIPFPYMELIQKMHREHEKNPTQSTLASWTSLLDEILFAK
jgi:hypothetical protein